jgi:maltoporin
MRKHTKPQKNLRSVHSQRSAMLRTWSFAALIQVVASVSAHATDVAGLEVSGYSRGGVFVNDTGMPRGGYTLGGDMQKYRLGNEGDNGFELEVKKTFDAGDGMKWSMDFMPTVWNGKTYTQQAYAEMTGLDFAPAAKFWAGQRRLRIQDVHIVDCLFMDYGLNFGAGVTEVGLGFAKLGVGIFNGGSLDNKNSDLHNARRVNVDLSEIKVNEGGTLRVLGTVISGNFQYAEPGSGLSVSHNQSNFLTHNLTNTLFVQSASGHAALNGQFQGFANFAYDGTVTTAELPGLKSWRIGESVNWQSGAFGGQAVASLQNGKIEGGASDGVNTRDFTLGGRISYAFTRNFKLLTEVGTTSREIDGQNKQLLNKVTIAPTLALAKEFWSRPELRFYVTQAIWNDAAAAANVAGFGAGGRTASTTGGIQMEVWW